MQERSRPSFDMAETAVPSESSCSDDESEQYISPSARKAAEETEFVATPSPWLFGATLHPGFMSAAQQTGPYMQDPLSMLVASAAAAANSQPMAPLPQYMPSVLPETRSTQEVEISQSFAAIAMSHAWQQHPQLAAAPQIHLAEQLQGAASKEELAQWEVQAFVARWGLNGKSAAIIAGLSHAARQDVFQNFQANAVTRDVNAKFMSWLSSKMRSINEFQSCLSTTAEERQDFYWRWKLDAKCRVLVEEQQPHVQRELISNFNPPPGTTNVAGRMTAFLNMILNKPGQQRCCQEQSTEVEQFVSRWGLDSDARSSLAKLPRDLQASVMQAFNPVCEPSLVSRKFAAYVKSVQPKFCRGRGKTN